MKKYIKASASFFTSWEQLPTSELLDVLSNYFDSIGSNGGSTAGFIKFAENSGIDMSGIPNSRVNELWDMVADYVDDATDSPIVIDGVEIYDESDAYRWLQSKLNQYGNTYHFPGPDRANLDKLIEKFGNTYFWGR